MDFERNRVNFCKANVGYSCPLPPTFHESKKKIKVAARVNGQKNKHSYFIAVAQIRYIMRKVFRLIDDYAKEFGLIHLRIRPCCRSMAAQVKPCE